MDAAYWRKGCSSLGRLRLAVLIAIGSGKSGAALPDGCEGSDRCRGRSAKRGRLHAAGQRRAGGDRGAQSVAISRRPHARPRICWESRSSSASCCRRTSSSRSSNCPAPRPWMSRRSWPAWWVVAMPDRCARPTARDGSGSSGAIAVQVAGSTVVALDQCGRSRFGSRGGLPRALPSIREGSGRLSEA